MEKLRGQGHSIAEILEDSQIGAQKLRDDRNKLGQDHLRMMRDKRGKPSDEVKIDMLKFYEMQMEGRAEVDNKQINQLSTSSED